MNDDFSGDINTIGTVAVDGTAEGNIQTVRDRDLFAVELVAGREHQIDLRVSPTGDGTLSDHYLHGIHDAAGDRIAGTSDDDHRSGPTFVIAHWKHPACVPTPQGRPALSCGRLGLLHL